MGSIIYYLVMRALTRKWIEAVNSLKLVFWSLKFLPPGTWFRFWFLWTPDTVVSLKDHRFVIRTESLPAKIVDLYMAASCVLAEQYSPKGFDIKLNDTVIDIGAHIGSFTVLAGKRAKNGRVLAYEPDPANYKQLEKNIKANNLSNVILSSDAVLDRQATIPFHKDTFNTAESSVFKLGNETISIKSTTLADIFTEQKIERCDLLKIDCEGAEYDILFHALPTMMDKIDKIVMECHAPGYFDIINEAYTPKRMAAYLIKSGFETKTVYENKLHSLIFAKRAHA